MLTVTPWEVPLPALISPTYHWLKITLSTLYSSEIFFWFHFFFLWQALTCLDFSRCLDVILSSYELLSWVHVFICFIYLFIYFSFSLVSFWSYHIYSYLWFCLLSIHPGRLLPAQSVLIQNLSTCPPLSSKLAKSASPLAPPTIYLGIKYTISKTHYN